MGNFSHSDMASARCMPRIAGKIPARAARFRQPAIRRIRQAAKARRICRRFYAVKRAVGSSNDVGSTERAPCAQEAWESSTGSVLWSASDGTPRRGDSDARQDPHSRGKNGVPQIHAAELRHGRVQRGNGGELRWRISDSAMLPAALQRPTGVARARSFKRRTRHHEARRDTVKSGADPPRGSPVKRGFG